MPEHDQHPVLANLITRAEAATYARVSLRTLADWTAAGRLSAIRYGGRIFYDRDTFHAEIDAMLAAGDRPATTT